jgi:hypothetical protein
MEWGVLRLIVSAALFVGALSLSIISLVKHGQFLVKLRAHNPSLASLLDWDYFGDGASKRGYEIMIFFYKKKYTNIVDDEINKLGNQIRSLNLYAIVLILLSVITLSM